MSYQLTGKIKSVSEVKVVSDSFKVREFVVTIDADGKYPQHIQLQTTNEKCDALNAFTSGSDVTVAFNLRGREWTNPQGEVKYFNSLDAWRIEAGAGIPQGDAAPSQIPTNQQPVSFDPANSEGDNLPF